jgi:hypothetical protein
MIAINHEINEIIQSIDATTLLFYQQNNEAGYAQLDQLLVLLMQGFNSILSYKAKGFDIGIEESQINNVLNEAMKAMQNKDTILLSDILCYDIKGLFNSILESKIN